MRPHILIALKLLLISIILTLSSCASRDYQTLDELRGHKAGKILREIFDFYAGTNCIQYATKGARVFSGKQFAMLQERFLLASATENEFGEYEISIAIAPKNHPEKIKMWYLMLSKDAMEPAGYAIIKFDEHEFVSVDGKKWPFDSENLPYWVDPVAKFTEEKKYCIGSYPVGIIYGTGLPQKLREVLDYYSNDDSLKTKRNFDKVSDYIKYFPEKFIVTSIRKTQQDASCKGRATYSLDVFISPKKPELLTFEIFENKENQYEICNIYSFPMTNFSKRGIYYWHEFKKYWI